MANGENDTTVRNCIDCDVVVCGTGLTECLIATSLAGRGFRVIQLESRKYYGGEIDASLSLSNLVDWCETENRLDPENHVNNGTSSCDSSCSCELTGAAKVLSQHAYSCIPIQTRFRSVMKNRRYFLNRAVLAEKIAKDETQKLSCATGACDPPSDSFPSVDPPSSSPSGPQEDFVVREPVVRVPSDQTGGINSDPSESPTVAAHKKAPGDDPCCSSNPVEQTSAEPPNLIKLSASELVNLTFQGKFSLDLVPRLMYSKSPIIDILIAARVGQYIDFRAMDSSILLGVPSGWCGLASRAEASGASVAEQPDSQRNHNSDGSIVRAQQIVFTETPVSRGEIFRNKDITLAERRALMKFLRKCSDIFHINSRTAHTSEANRVGNFVLTSPAAAVYGSKEAEFGEESILNPEQYVATQQHDNQARMFAQIVAEHEKATTQWRGLIDESGLTEKLKSYLYYGVCMSERGTPNTQQYSQPVADGNVGSKLINKPTELASRIEPDLPSSEQLANCWTFNRLKLFITSLGIHSTVGPYIFPMYGTGEISQALSRASALQGAVHMLQAKISCLHTTSIRNSAVASADLEKSEFTLPTSPLRNQNKSEFQRISGVQVNNGTFIHTNFVIAAPSEVQQLSTDHNDEGVTSPDVPPDSSSATLHAHHGISVTTTPLLGGLGFRILCVLDSTGERLTPSCQFRTGKNPEHEVVTGGCDPTQCRHPVQAIQLDSTSGCCPAGYYVTHFRHLCEDPNCLKNCEPTNAVVNALREFGVNIACPVIHSVFDRLLIHSCVVPVSGNGGNCVKEITREEISKACIFFCEYIQVGGEVSLQASVKNALRSAGRLRSKQSMVDYELSLQANRSEKPPCVAEVSKGETKKLIDPHKPGRLNYPGGLAEIQDLVFVPDPAIDSSLFFLQEPLAAMYVLRIILSDQRIGADENFDTPIKCVEELIAGPKYCDKFRREDVQE